MKPRTTLLILFFYINAVTAFSMVGELRLQKKKMSGANYGQYGSTNARERMEMQGGLLLERPSTIVQQPRAISTAVDQTIVEQQEDVIISSSEDFLRQKIQEAEEVAKKWKNCNRKRPDINLIQKDIEGDQNENIAIILREVTDDLRYWVAQKERISSYLNQDMVQETKRVNLINESLFSQLLRAANSAIEEAQTAAKFYDNLLDPPQTIETVPVSQNMERLSSRKGNPLNENYKEYHEEYHEEYHGFQSFSEDSSIRVIKVPTLQGHLIANTIEEISNTWIDSAEIRYDKNAKTYMSSQCQPRGFLSMIRRVASRDQKERKQHRDAIEKIAQELEPNRSEVVKNFWRVRVHNFFGEPLTPQLIELIKTEIEQGGEGEVRRNETALERLRKTSSYLFEEIVSLWRRQLSNNQYAPIPSEE